MNNPIYTLSPFQLQSLAKAAENPKLTVSSAFSAEDDSLRLRELLDGSCEALAELVSLGLLLDISHRFRRRIAEYEETNGRRFGVWLLTLNGFRMFYGAESTRTN